MRSEELRALSALAACRTATLGGQLDVCRACGFSRPAYNSCHLRHCPRCQSLRQARWTEARRARVLPTHYFHVVFTLPAPLRSLTLRHRSVIFDLLFTAASQTLLTLANDPAYLGAEPGLTTVLHTWTRELAWHPHLHCIVTGGGLTEDGAHWKGAPKKFLFPVHVLGALFRGKFLAALARAMDRGAIPLREPERARLFDELYRTRWVVYCKRPFGGPDQVIRYLGRYTHRVGISNGRLVDVGADHVLFRTKSGRTCTLEPLEFLRRLLQHVLPDRFVKIRHCGLHASSNVPTRLERARALLGCAPTPSTAVSQWQEMLLAPARHVMNSTAAAPSANSSMRSALADLHPPVAIGQLPGLSGRHWRSVRQAVELLGGRLPAGAARPLLATGPSRPRRGSTNPVGCP